MRPRGGRVVTLEGQDDKIAIRCFLKEGTLMDTGLFTKRVGLGLVGDGEILDDFFPPLFLLARKDRNGHCQHCHVVSPLKTIFENCNIRLTQIDGSPLTIWSHRRPKPGHLAPSSSSRFLKAERTRL